MFLDYWLNFLVNLDVVDSLSDYVVEFGVVDHLFDGLLLLLLVMNDFLDFDNGMSDMLGLDTMLELLELSFLVFDHSIDLMGLVNQMEVGMDHLDVVLDVDNLLRQMGVHRMLNNLLFDNSEMSFGLDEGLVQLMDGLDSLHLMFEVFYDDLLVVDGASHVLLLGDQQLGLSLLNSDVDPLNMLSSSDGLDMVLMSDYLLKMSQLLDDLSDLFSLMDNHNLLVHSLELHFKVSDFYGGMLHYLFTDFSKDEVMFSDDSVTLFDGMSDLLDEFCLMLDSFRGLNVFKFLFEGDNFSMLSLFLVGDVDDDLMLLEVEFSHIVDNLGSKLLNLPPAIHYLGVVPDSPNYLLHLSNTPLKVLDLDLLLPLLNLSDSMKLS